MIENASIPNPRSIAAIIKATLVILIMVAYLVTGLAQREHLPSRHLKQGTRESHPQTRHTFLRDTFLIGSGATFLVFFETSSWLDEVPDRLKRNQSRQPIEDSFRENKLPT